MALKEAERDFELWLDQSRADSPRPEVAARMPRRIQEAHNAAITLGEIADVAHHFAMYPSQEVADGLRGLFANPNASDSFAQQVVAPLLAFFQDGQGSPPATETELCMYRDLIFKVKEMILDPTCKLFKVLLSFCLPIRELLCDVLFDVDANLEKQGLPGVWTDIMQRERMMIQEGEVYALCDPYFLREILRNVCTNVRYNLSGPRVSGSLSSHVRIDISESQAYLPEPDAVQQDFLVIVIEAGGASYSSTASAKSRKGHTLKSHIERIPEFGGMLEIGDGENGHGSRTKIKLISRQDMAHLVAEESNDRST